MTHNPKDPNTTSWSRRIFNIEYSMKKSASWSKVSSGMFGVRYYPNGFMFDVAGPGIFTSDDNRLYFMGLLNSKLSIPLIKNLYPTLNYETGQIGDFPVIISENDREQIAEYVNSCIELSKQDWDSFETSWDFMCHPLVENERMQIISCRNDITIEECYRLWAKRCEMRFAQVKANEEAINSLLIKIYGLQDELTSDVEDQFVTINHADLNRDIKSLLLYAVGCMFGRYSLFIPGLVYAGGNWDEKKYGEFMPDSDNIIPISDEEYLEDDIVSRLCEFLKVAFGESTLEKNLDYIALVLGGKGDSSRDIIRNYFVKDFFKDHCQTYSVTGSGKRPIYWLFDSGKQNGFKALVYIHRYNVDTIGNLRIDYLHRMQRIYESEINRMQDMIDNSINGREVVIATKRREKLMKQLKECREYDEKLAHLALSRIELDLDDGVKKNYRKIQTANDGKFYEVLADSKNIMAKK